MNKQRILMALLTAAISLDRPLISRSRQYEHKSGKWRIGSGVQQVNGGPDKRTRNKARRQAIAKARKR